MSDGSDGDDESLRAARAFAWRRTPSGRERRREGRPRRSARTVAGTGRDARGASTGARTRESLVDGPGGPSGRTASAAAAIAEVDHDDHCAVRFRLGTATLRAKT